MEGEVYIHEAPPIAASWWPDWLVGVLGLLRGRFRRTEERRLAESAGFAGGGQPPEARGPERIAARGDARWRSGRGKGAARPTLRLIVRLRVGARADGLSGKRIEGRVGSKALFLLSLSFGAGCLRTGGVRNEGIHSCRERVFGGRQDRRARVNVVSAFNLCSFLY